MTAVLRPTGPSTSRASGRLAAASCLALLICAVTSLLLLRGPSIAAVVFTVGAVAFVLLARADVAALVFIAAAPFEGYLTAVSASSVKILGLVLFAAWAYRLVTQGTSLRHDQALVVAAGAFAAVLMAATLVHQNGQLGTQVLVRYLSYLTALVVLFDLMHDRLSPRTVAQLYVGACSIAAVLGLVSFARHTFRAGGPVGDPNDFAFFMVAALPLCLALRQGAKHVRLHDLAATVLTLAIAASLSRGAALGLAAMLVIATATGRIRLRRVLRTAAVVGLLAIVVLAVRPARVSHSLQEKSVVAQQNIDDRLVRWEAAAQMTHDHPVLGLGPAGFRENFDRYIDFQESNVLHHLDVAHEMYLEVSSELGILGLVAFLAILVTGFTGARERSHADDPDAALASGVCLAFVGVAVAAVFLTEQYYLPIWLLAALGAALKPRSVNERRG